MGAVPPGAFSRRVGVFALLLAHGGSASVGVAFGLRRKRGLAEWRAAGIAGLKAFEAL